MRRPQSAFGLAAVMAGLLVVTLSPASVQAAPNPAAPSECTGHRSDRVPPETIRVLRTKRSRVPKKVAGTVQTVDFREYVGVVMAAEWPTHYPIESLKAGAIAVKQYGWFYTKLYRGGTKKVDGTRVCYDVVDTTVDQVYYPERHSASTKIHKAINTTWDITLRKYQARTKSSKQFLSGYRAGTSGVCGAEVTGFKLFQRGVRDCGAKGKTMDEILRIYLNPRLEIVRHGRHDIIGGRHGDAAALIRDDGDRDAHVWTLGASSPEPGSNAGLTIVADDAIGPTSADMDRDGKDDLVWLKPTGPTTGRIRVARSDGTNYGEATTWFDGELGVSLGKARLVVGDFDADLRRDVAVIGRNGGDTRVRYLRRKKGDEFEPPTTMWNGSLDLDRVRNAWARDVSGDGRADLIVREDRDDGGLRIKVARVRKDGTLRELKERFTSSTLKPSRTRVIPVDANRDGREDLMLIIGGDGRTKIDRLQGQTKGGFKRIRIWKAPSSDPIPVGDSKVGAADVDYDGRTDLILFTKDGGGTRVRVLKTRYAKMAPGYDDDKPGLSWSDIRPY